MGVRFLLAVLVFSALAPLFADAAIAQEESRIFDEANVLNDARESEVQSAFERASTDSGQSLHAFIVDDSNVNANNLEAQREYVLDTVRDESLPGDAGVIVVDTKSEWSQVYNLDGDVEQSVNEAMRAGFADGEFAEGLIAGASQYQDSLSVVPELLTAGGILGALAALVGGAAFFLIRGRRQKLLEEERRAAEEEFAGLTERINVFDEKERLVAGYLEAQRPLLDQRTENWVEERITEARTAGFANEFNEAAAELNSAPASARERLARGRALLDEALGKLDEAEKTMDDYRAADEALDGHLRAAAEEITSAEKTEASVRAEGVTVQPLDMRPEYDRLAREAAGRAARRDEYDPRQAIAATDALAEQARMRREALREEIEARDALPEERRSCEGALLRARESLAEYETAHDAALREWGPAAIGEAPAPAEISSNLRRAEGLLESADRAASAGSYAEARSLARQARDLAQNALDAPLALKTATADADLKKREGEEKLRELEIRLEQAKANEHRMNPAQRRQLREYERRLDDARGGFFGSDWLTAILIFEALDNDYVYMGDPSSMTGEGDWGGGDWSEGDWGGGDWGGGGDFGGGGW